MSVSIQGRLPAGPERNGLAHVEPLLAEDPEREIVVIMRLDCAEIVEKRGVDGEFVYKLRPLQVEAILDPADKEFALSQMRATMENRTGKPSLPFGQFTEDVDNG